MSARDCPYCERDNCDSDCSFADRCGERRKTAAEWRAIGAAELMARMTGPASHDPGDEDRR